MDIKKLDGAIHLPLSGPQKCVLGDIIKNPPAKATPVPVASFPLFCRGCKSKFSDRVSLEEHPCTYVNYICTCGMAFPQYLQMKGHQLEHGDQDLSRILLNWIRREEPVKTLDLFVQTQSMKPPPPAGMTEKPPAPMTLQELERPRGATVDLRRRFLPVVCLKTRQRMVRGKKFRCAFCHQTFSELDALVEHHHSHAREGVYGCLRCGLLLVSHASLPSHHLCSDYYATPSTRYTMGNVLSKKVPEQQGKTFFRCQRCPVAYSREIQLQKHEMTCGLGPMNGLNEKEMLRCLKCKGHFSSVKRLREHHCEKSPTLVCVQVPQNKSQIQTQVRNEARERASPYLVPQRHHEEEVTFRFHTSHNMKTYKHQPVDNGCSHGIIGEPLRLRGLEKSPAFNPVTVSKAVVEAEIDDDCYVVESNSTKPNRPSPQS